MAKVMKSGKKFKVVHSITGVPTSLPTFKSRSKAESAAATLRCELGNKKRVNKLSCDDIALDNFFDDL